MRQLRTASIIVATAGLLASACSSSDTSTSDPASTTGAATTSGGSAATDTTQEEPTPSTGDSSADTTPATSAIAPIEGPDTIVYELSGGRQQATLTGGEPGERIQLVADQTVIAERNADDNGAIVFRDLPLPEAPVNAQSARGASGEAKVGPIDAVGEAAFYAEQRLPTTNTNEGRLGYITTLDGTTLSASVWLPGPVEDGPYPTVVEYSGYDPSNPEKVGMPQIFNGLGYAYVGVNLRGTGCSGGSFQYFEYQQSMDGYDMVETVAAQPWVLNQQVGLVGVSYPGISQLFVSQTQPPSLAAISPLSVIADSYESVLYPGGILNVGFGVDWLSSVIAEAKPEGQGWTSTQIDSGDETCAANQGLRLQNPDDVTRIGDNPFWNTKEYEPLAPRLFIDKINVPTYVAGAWQDEQTGSDFANMLTGFTGTNQLFVTLSNGIHTESLTPASFTRLVEFLELYVAERTPSLDRARATAPLVSASLFGTSDITLPADDRFAGMSYDEARAAFEAEPRVEVLFEQGAAEGSAPRTPLPRFTAGFDQFPVSDATDTTWYLNGDGGGEALLGAEPGDAATTTYVADPNSAPQTFNADDLWSVDATYDWKAGARDTYAAWLSAPLDADTTVVGTGAVDLWVSADAPDTDIEVTLSEVRPDGNEVYVQSGWLRASHRALDPERSTTVRPVPTNTEADAAPLPADEPVAARVEILPFGHVFRAGSRLRLTVDAPGGNRAEWSFGTISDGEKVTITSDDEHQSRLVLPVVDLAAQGVTIPAEYPPCDALRGQPCRPFAST